MHGQLAEYANIEQYLHHAPIVSQLDDKSFPKDIYAAYAKVILERNDAESWSIDVDKRIAQAMHDNGVYLTIISEAFSFSPNFENKLEDERLSFLYTYLNFSEQMIKEYKIERYLCSAFKIKTPKQLSFEQLDYFNYAKRVLSVGEMVNIDVDKKIIEYIVTTNIDSLGKWKILLIDFRSFQQKVFDVMACSPNYNHSSKQEIENIIKKALSKYVKNQKLIVAIVITSLIACSRWGHSWM